jgi:cell division protein ZapA (FtsZ GTPase activity inhibitor)
MAALAIADELHSLKEQHGDRDEILKEQAERCLNLVERALMKKQ